MKKKTAAARSPRFPFLGLRKAIEQVHSLMERSGDGKEELAASSIFESLGFHGPSGKANKILAALAAYGLVTKVRVEGEERVFVLTELAKSLAKNKGGKNLARLREAALHPVPFRRIWLNRPQVTEEELMSLFQERGFTEEGAKRATTVYRNNVRFAELDDPQFRASGVVAPLNSPRSRKAGQIVGNQGRLPGGGSMDPTQGLSLPLRSGVAYIPRGMSEEEFQALMQTLRLWKAQLVTG
ncbi:MAG: hypothetical protein AAF191_03655 [Verrucomicrobiota bacterium]